jgi:hypothetical protein
LLDLSVGYTRCCYLECLAGIHGTTLRANSVVDRHSIMHLQLVPPKAIKLALHGQMASRWARADVLGRDPRVAPSVGIEMCTHAAWVLKFQEGGCTVPKHLKLCVSFAVLHCLARLRLGWHQLRVRTDRLKKAHARLPRNQRLCQLCSIDGAPFLALRVGGCCVEDVKHFLLECHAYHHLRARDPCVFGDAVPDGTTQSTTQLCFLKQRTWKRVSSSLYNPE